MFSLNSDTQNNQNRTNLGFINTTDRYSNSAHISIPDKEVSISQKVKNKNSDIKQNNLIDSPFTFSNVSTNKKGSNKRVIDIDVESIDNSNIENNINFDYNYFGEKYINLNKKNGKENKARNNDQNSINQYEDESIENGVPVLNKDNYYNANSEPIKTTLSLHKNKMIANNAIIENQNMVETSNYTNKINKDLLLNKMRKCEITLPKRKTEPKKPKVFFVGVSEELKKHIPAEILQNAEFIVQREQVEEYPLSREKMAEEEIKAAKLLERYKKEATLVVSPLLHCITPCIGMGIPVILARDYYNDRFSSVCKLTKLYLKEDYDKIDWHPKAIDVENLKRYMIALAEDKIINNVINKEYLDKIESFYNNK